MRFVLTGIGPRGPVAWQDKLFEFVRWAESGMEGFRGGHSD